MSSIHLSQIAGELGIRSDQVAATVTLLDDEATVPFIARYRKEATGSLDEVTITSIRDRIAHLRELDKRREAICKSLEERGLLTDELKQALETAETMAVLEDIYLPFRPKRRTRATIAIERGLEPLAQVIFVQDEIDPVTEAEKFVDPEKEIASAEDALAGARDIIAGWINEDSGARARLRELFARKGVITARVISGKESEGARFSDYFDWQEPLAEAPSHRILAMRRGEAESILNLSIAPPEDKALAILEEIFVISDNASSGQVRLAVHDAYKRLLSPAMETEMRIESRNRADQEAIRVFAENLRELLMAPPLGQKNILAIDPGFRTGCKAVCLDAQGKLEHHTTIFPHGSAAERSDAAGEIKALCERFQIRVIAIGNGTAGRETEAFVRGIGLGEHILIEMVNESGASVYSASKVAREEFPDHDITVRGAVSIGRRLMDPLAELVKIDPKSIGVGQYQHDVEQNNLKQGLDDTVASCVNAVGVEVNTASKQLLTYVSGLGPNLAQNIVAYRDEHGPFKSRKTFQKVSRLGPKAFEQAAGFLRISDGKNPLDRSAVHPESYSVVEAMAKELNCNVSDLMSSEELRGRIDLERHVSGRTGMPTLRDIMDELAKPGRDPRKEFVPFCYDDSVNTIEDVNPGMTLPGIVTNVTAFGAFVDIGVHQDGLVHISELADQFVKDPAEVVRVRQKVSVTVLEVDLERGRISLSMRKKRPS
ncbi:MAG: RNA-binding transcriptional accessory protein [Candidatus Zixiibacteriota bacterium]|nr:MAG: RNA-binding transcriptional accessory protein [candidate division Zixibacteria bacterium]